MANSTSGYKLWSLDSLGVISETGVWIRKLYFVPNAADDVAVVKVFTTTKVAAGGKVIKTGTITSTTTLTSNGNLPSTILDGYVFEITKTSGTADNLGKKLVKTAGSGNAVVIHDADWTNEASKVYNWVTYTTQDAIVMKAGAADAEMEELDFHDRPLFLPNFCLDQLTGGTLYVYLA